MVNRKAPPLQCLISYETAAALQHMMLAAYVNLKEHNEDSYAHVCKQTDPFFKFLTDYLERYE